MKPTRLVFLSACLGMALFGAAFITLGSIAPSLQQKFGMSGLEAGTLFSLLPFGILGGSLVFGPIADRYGYRIELVIAALLMSAGFLGIAWATNTLMLNACILLFGFSGGIINGACNAAVADISVSKGANLNIVGVFFAVGSLGMPLILGVVGAQVPFEQIVSGFGYFTLFVALIFLLARFPPPKQAEGISTAKVRRLLSEPLLLLAGFFLFCQSSFEGIVNNWTTTYLMEEVSIAQDKALFALSVYVVGMAVMRVLLGSVFRKFTPSRSLTLSFGLLIAAAITLQFAGSFSVAAAGLALLGAGLAAGFPVILGIVGENYAELSGTAFSIVITIALIGNMLLNFLMGVVAGTWGIQHFTTMMVALIIAMIIITQRILKKINQKTYAVETMA